MRHILYDVTRLLARHKAPFATGIDRVDLQYVNYFLSRPNAYRVHCVYQRSGAFELLREDSAAAMVRILKGRWLEQATTGEEDARSLANIFSRTLGVADTVLTSARLERELATSSDGVPLGTPLINALLKARNEEYFYFNTSHHSIASIPLFLALRTLVRARFVFFLHDLIPIEFPEYVRDGDEVVHAKRVEIMSRIADLVIVNSSFTKERLASHLKGQSLPVPRIQVLRIGAEDAFRSPGPDNNGAATIALRQPYFVAVGTIEPRKNHLLLLHIWRRMVAQLGDRAPWLVIVGSRGWNNQAVFDMLDRSPLVRRRVAEVSNLSDARMLDIVSNARALLFPSFVEGWGMPLVEAMTLGIPAVCADIPALRESGSELAHYLDPLDAVGWRSAIEALASSTSPLHQELRARLGGFSPPTWQDHFDQMEQCLGEILEAQTQAPACVEVSDEELRLRFERYVTTTGNGAEGAERRLADGISRSEGLVFALLSERGLRKYRKLSRDPVRFLVDSRVGGLTAVGKFLARSRKR